MAEDAGARNVELSTKSIEAEELVSAATIDKNDDVQIVDKPGTKSQISKYFGLHANQNEKPVNNGIAVCQYSGFTSERPGFNCNITCSETAL